MKLLAIHVNLAGVHLVRAIDKAQRFGTARTDQTRKAEDLTRVDLEGDVLHAVAAQVLCLEHEIADFCLTRREVFVQLPADHQRDELLTVRVLHVQRLDRLAVTHDGHAVADHKNFRHTVGDEDHRDSLLLQIVDQPEQNVDLVDGQRRRRLVENQNFGSRLEMAFAISTICL